MSSRPVPLALALSLLAGAAGAADRVAVTPALPELLPRGQEAPE